MRHKSRTPKVLIKIRKALKIKFKAELHKQKITIMKESIE